MVAPVRPPKKPDERVWGIVALAAALVPAPLWLFEEIYDVAFFASFAGAIVAIVFGAVGISKTKGADSMTGRGLAIAGLVLGIVELATVVIAFLVVVFVFAVLLAACAGCGGAGAFGVGMAGGRRLEWRSFLTAHHPESAECEADVFRVCGRRWCVGCTVGLGSMLVTSGVLWLASPSVSWEVLVGSGVILGSTQLVSVAGRARRRTAKVAVKALVGVGLALTVSGILAAPVGVAGGRAAIVALSAVVVAAGVVRARRLARIDVAA